MGRMLTTCALVALLALAACTATPSGPSSLKSDDPWADIDTHFPSEDPVATVYGYVQAMAQGDDEAACAFQYRGSSDFNPRPCVLADEMPRRDRAFSSTDWESLAGYQLTDYAAAEDSRGWKVTIPQGVGVTWRIEQDDAGIWFIS